MAIFNSYVKLPEGTKCDDSPSVFLLENHGGSSKICDKLLTVGGKNMVKWRIGWRVFSDLELLKMMELILVNPILLVVPNQQIHDENMEFHEFSTWDLEYDPC